MSKLKGVVLGVALGVGLLGCEPGAEESGDKCLGRCTTDQVCSPQATCVPDCRKTGQCPAGLTCNTTTGLCAVSTPGPDASPGQKPDGLPRVSDAGPPPPPPPVDGSLPPPPPGDGSLPPPTPGDGSPPPPPLGDGGPPKPCSTAADCGKGQVCASPPGVCLPDCRLIGGCPAHVPVCNPQTGVCEPS